MSAGQRSEPRGSGCQPSSCPRISSRVSSMPQWVEATQSPTTTPEPEPQMVTVAGRGGASTRAHE